MSLINDALKRASSKPGQVSPSVGGPPLQPAETPSSSSSGSMLILPVLTVVVILAGTFFWWKGKEQEVSEAARQSEAVSAPAQESAVVTSKALTEPASPPEVTMQAEAPAARRAAVSNSGSPEQPAGPAEARANPEPTPAAVVPSPSTAAASGVAATAKTPRPATVPGSKQDVRVEAKFPELRLQAIYFRIQRPTAVINGRTVGIGDRIDGATVTSIQRTEVALEFEGKKKTISLD